MASTWRATPFVQASVALHVAAALAVVAVPAWWPWALVAVLANQALITGAGLWPRSTWLGPNWTRLPDAAVRHREVALTIDDGPDPDVTPQVLDLLDQYGVKATFFCIGDRARQHPELCRDIVERGHAVENHSQRHGLGFAWSGPRGFARELAAAQDTLATITGQRPVFFRAPAGLRNPFLTAVLPRLGLTLASWTARGFDTRVGDAARVRRALVGKLTPGAILLLHDGHAARTASGRPVILEVLPALFDAARAEGLAWVRLRDARS